MSRARFDPSKAKGAGQMDLFGPAKLDGPISVSALTRMIKRALEDHLPERIMVAGEISNLKRQSSGHLYFSLKDGQSQIPAVMWQGRAGKVRFDLANGLAVIATGQVEVYEPQGKYQLMVQKIVPEGMGALELAFRQLKEKLSKEGLFEASAKKALPRFPRTVALVTSATGAAVRDMVRTLVRRFGPIRILLYPVAVQGTQAAGQIAEALGELDRQKEKLGGIDVIILGRGGGSLEDLWAFNEEVVGRAIFACGIPIISAVGHETDVTIADMVADKRAATPTGGAQLAVPVLSEVVAGLLISRGRLARYIGQCVERSRGRLERVLASRFFRRPLAEVMSKGQGVDEVTSRLGRAMSERVSGAVRQMMRLERRFMRVSPRAAFGRAAGKVRLAEKRLRVNVEGRVRRAQRSVHYKMVALARRSPGQLVRLREVGLAGSVGRLRRGISVVNDIEVKRLEAVAGRLRAVGPEKVLARGYSVTMDSASGEVISDASGLGVGQELVTRLSKGQVASTVKSIRK